MTNTTLNKVALDFNNWLPFLDGIRGIAALWVLAHHSLILCGWSFPILKDGKTAVDVFMIMSGFLMTFHFCKKDGIELRKSYQNTCVFYTRRFFRIAPLYYVILIPAFIFNNYLGDCREIIGTFFPKSVTDMDRYHDSSILNIFMHITFLFGLFPQYSFNTPLPDWSIGLEMQFYAVFPLMMLLFKNLSYFWPSLFFIGIYFISNKFISDIFQMPSFLPLKIVLFLIGILLAFANYYKSKKTKLSAYIVVLALFISRFSNSLIIPLISTLIAAILLYDRTNDPLKINKLIQIPERILSTKLSSYLAETSYSVYLLHLLILLPLAAWLTNFSIYINMPGGIRFIILVTLTAFPTYLIAWLLFQYVEKPGIFLGKKIVKLCFHNTHKLT